MTPSSTPRALEPAASAAMTARVTLLSVATATGLVALKFAGWWMSGSVSLLASTADSALDFVAAAATFWAVRYAVAPPDAEHRFGHGKAEAYASLLQAGLVLVSAALIGREAVARLISPRPVQAELAGAVVLVVSILATLGLMRAQAKVIERTGSVAVSGDRAHYAADLASNLAALVGVIGAKLTGEPRLDAAAGLVVAGWLVWTVVGVFREASHHLMDRELDDGDRDAILKLALDDPEVLGVHEFKTRASGPFVHIQMHMELEPDQTLDAAHQIVERAERRIQAIYPGADVLIHADPYGRAEPHGHFGDETIRD